MLQILPLKNQCEVFIKANICVDNCLRIYRNLKPAGSTSVVSLAWKFILRHFHELKDSQDLLDLDFNDLKSLIEDGTLCTKSEDSVIRLILNWTSYNSSEDDGSNQHCDRASREEVMSVSDDSDDGVASHVNESLQTTHLNSVKESQVAKMDAQIQTDCLTSGSLRVSARFCPRAKFLHELLTLCRLHLVSNSCLAQLLDESCLIQQVAEAKTLVMKLLGWKLKGVGACNPCSIWSLRRQSETTENVVIWFEMSEGVAPPTTAAESGGGFSFGSCSGFSFGSCSGRGNTPTNPPPPTSSVAFGFTLPTSLSKSNMRCVQLNRNYLPWTKKTVDFTPCATAVWNDQVFVLPKQDLDGIFICSLLTDSNFTRIGFNNKFVKGSNVAMAVVGNRLYVVGNDVLLLTESKRDVHLGSAHITTMPSHLYFPDTQVTNITVATVGSNIIIFGRESGNEQTDVTVVQCIDTHLDVGYRLSDIQANPQGMTVFQTYDETFVLFRSGALWKLKENHETGHVKARFVSLLWDYDRALCGATLVKGELWLFTEELHDDTCTVTVEGVFTKVKSVQAKGGFFMNAVAPNTNRSSSLF
ncbi:uncharacterized protein LOC106011101 [Aplysia californica]|uniref:Uncharacterized protein LOC106011101 n=1 Tax=Aplysia californica TaxID=6500 RepID=A0ABM0ZUW6_APLCA|nr:uncharacterized protein LOC106011101 [Aplysia californica]